MFKVNNQSLTLMDRRKTVNHSQEYLYCTFPYLSDDWNGLTLFALFTVGTKKYRVAVINNKALVPNAVLKGDRFTVMLYGISGETVRVTTNQELVYLEDSGYTPDVEDDLPDDDPEIVEQIYEAIDTAKSDAEAYADTGLALKVNIADVVDNLTTDDASKVLSAKQGKSLKTLVDGKANSTHTHTKSEITDFAHNHDDRYYTESEMDTKLNGKSNTGHTHTESEITDLKSYVLTSNIVDNLTTNNSSKVLSAKQGKTLKDTADALAGTVTSISNSVSSINVIKQSTADTGYFATYYIQKDGNQLGAKINIPKDFLLKSASLLQCTVDGEPLEDLHVGDWYFDWVLNTTDGTGTDSHLYLNANVLTDVYEADEVTIIIQEGVISVKPDVFADKTHTHTRDEITDFVHNHDERYYTEYEVRELLEQTKHELLNRLSINTDNLVIENGETSTISANLLENGVPASGKTVYFYEEYNPGLTIASDRNIIETSEPVNVIAKVTGNDGRLVKGETVYFFEETEDDENDNEEE